MRIMRVSGALALLLARRAPQFIQLIAYHMPQHQAAAPLRGRHAMRYIKSDETSDYSMTSS